MTKAWRATGRPGGQAWTACLSGSASVINGKRVAASACPAARSTLIAAPISAAERASSGCAERGGGTPITATSSAVTSNEALTSLALERTERSDAVILPRHIAVGVVGQQRGRDKADNGAAQNVQGDRITRVIGREQRRRNQRRRPAGNDRGELIAERGAAVAQPRRKALGDHRRLRPVLHIVRDKRQHDREKDEPRHHRVEQREIHKPEDAYRRDPDQVHALAANAV